MKVIADYALLESHLLMLVTGLAQADPVTAGAMFGAIRNSSVQRDVINALAREVTDGATFARLERALKIVELAGGARNAFAHKIWALDPKLPDEVILIDPERLWRISQEVRRHGGPGQTTMAAYDAIVAEMRNKLSLWNIQEIVQAEKDCSNATTALLILNMIQSGPADEKTENLAKFETICGWYSV